jgi:hypothetical protein
MLCRLSRQQAIHVTVHMFHRNSESALETVGYELSNALTLETVHEEHGATQCFRIVPIYQTTAMHARSCIHIGLHRPLCFLIPITIQQGCDLKHSRVEAYTAMAQPLQHAGFCPEAASNSTEAPDCLCSASAAANAFCAPRFRYSLT